MNETSSKMFSPRGNKDDLENGNVFQPKFDANGLIPAIVVDAESHDVVMFAYMNPDALQLTLATGTAHFWSRSRGRMWKKGEESGNLLTVKDVRTDCDQDVVLLIVDIGGAGVACHTGAKSCFYRRISEVRENKPALLEHLATAK